MCSCDYLWFVFQILEKRAFEEINANNPIDIMTIESNGEAGSAAVSRAQGGLLQKLFKWKRSVSHDN